jgi:hypothetical protein
LLYYAEGELILLLKEPVHPLHEVFSESKQGNAVWILNHITPG